MGSFACATWPGSPSAPRTSSRTPRALLTAASALLFFVGLAISLAGGPEIARVVVYLAAAIVVGDKNGPAAVFGLADTLRPDAKATIEALRESGWASW